VINLSPDIVIVQSIYRRNVAINEAGKLICTVQENACALLIQDLWKAYLHREKFVRIVSNMHGSQRKESESATEIAKAWRGYNTKRKYLSMLKGKLLIWLILD
jgi:hypothetical protein